MKNPVAGNEWKTLGGLASLHHPSLPSTLAREYVEITKSATIFRNIKSDQDRYETEEKLRADLYILLHPFIAAAVNDSLSLITLNTFILLRKILERTSFQPIQPYPIHPAAHAAQTVSSVYE